MMGRQSGQLSMVVMDLSELIPDDHLLRRISRVISFDFIYELLEPYYPPNGRPSVDPVSMFKMLLVGYLYGIKSWDQIRTLTCTGSPIEHCLSVVLRI